MVSRGNEPLAGLLLEKGADVNIRSSPSLLLHLAKWNEDESIAKLLLNKGAEVEICNDSSSETALHIAAVFGDCAVTRLLLESGANVNPSLFPNHDRATPLLRVIFMVDVFLKRFLKESNPNYIYNYPCCRS